MTNRAHDEQAARREDAPPKAFIGQIKRALEHLYDIVYLEHHPLVFADGEIAAAEPSFIIGGQQLRWELSAAIESLNPGGHLPFSAPSARTYNLVSLRYVEGRTVVQAAQELNLSERQAHRELRHGEEMVATRLWARRGELATAAEAATTPAFAPGPDIEGSAARLSSFEAEMARFETHARPTDLRDLIRQAHQMVESQAAQQEICLRVQLPEEPLILSIDPVMAGQVLVNTLSYAVEQAHPGPLHLALDRAPTSWQKIEPQPGATGAIAVTVTYFSRAGAPTGLSSAGADPGSADVRLHDLVIWQLADRLGWRIDQMENAAGAQVLTLHIPLHGPTVLVVDDNEGLVSLLERYLTGPSGLPACRVVGAATGREGLELVQKLIPDAIVLDVMMPEMHGWEFLQRLRAQPATADIPVIICSVINNPRLAYSLGASLFLPKPVRRREVLEALYQVSAGRAWGQIPASPGPRPDSAGF